MSAAQLTYGSYGSRPRPALGRAATLSALVHICLLVVLFLMGLHSTTFGPIKYAILPQALKAASSALPPTPRTAARSRKARRVNSLGCDVPVESAVPWFRSRNMTGLLW